MVSLSEDSNRARGHFFEDQKEEDEFLTESQTLSLVVNTEQSGRKINTTFLIVFEIVLLLCVLASSFLVPHFCTGNSCGESSFSIVIYILGGVWFIQLLLDRFYRNQHYRNRLCGYLNFYRRTRNIRRLPLLIASAGNSILLILSQILWHQCMGTSHNCGSLTSVQYLQIIVCFLCAFQIIFLIIYLVRTVSFNKSGASPDVHQDEMVTSFLQTNSTSSDIGFRDENLMDQVLEKQADTIRYLRHHNEMLSKRVLALSEENQALRQTS